MADYCAERIAVTRVGSRAVWMSVKTALERAGSRTVNWVD